MGKTWFPDRGTDLIQFIKEDRLRHAIGPALSSRICYIYISFSAKSAQSKSTLERCNCISIRSTAALILCILSRLTDIEHILSRLSPCYLLFPFTQINTAGFQTVLRTSGTGREIFRQMLKGPGLILSVLQ